MAHENKLNSIHHSSYAVDYPGKKIDVSYSDENVICHALWSFHFHLGIRKKDFICIKIFNFSRVCSEAM